ncbi:hypothetical protein [Flammeovirga aprica]|uniref:Uncharacterized protein n=1 Tax=Flammeovirga aprica JL-4 TaxID=694437 RepID=A0A7X9S1M6_9BACT|nr:hypothetical protein [Flammeovirga aprica]NME72750.1 hypothetical protein [Flammeovirga aprica JL-4]
MRLYSLRKYNEHGKWNVMYTLRTEFELRLQDKISGHKFWENPTTIPMELVTRDKELINSEPWAQDLYGWTSYLSKQWADCPHSSLLVISERFLNLLKNFNLPDHRIYEIDILNKKNMNYFIFHPIWYTSEVDYAGSEYAIRDEETNEIVKWFDKGTIPSEEEFDNEYDKIPEGTELEIEKIAFRKPLDFIPRTPTSLGCLFTERLKNAFEENGLTGTSFYEYNPEKNTPVIFP